MIALPDRERWETLTARSLYLCYIVYFPFYFLFFLVFFFISQKVVLKFDLFSFPKNSSLHVLVCPTRRALVVSARSRDINELAYVKRFEDTCQISENLFWKKCELWYRFLPLRRSMKSPPRIMTWRDARSVSACRSMHANFVTEHELRILPVPLFSGKFNGRKAISCARMREVPRNRPARKDTDIVRERTKFEISMGNE